MSSTQKNVSVGKADQQTTTKTTTTAITTTTLTVPGTNTIIQVTGTKVTIPASFGRQHRHDQPIKTGNNNTTTKTDSKSGDAQVYDWGREDDVDWTDVWYDDMD
ncbi:hypothetical protein QR685DRAFT_518478 [Neurospora intermedia]|uniref:Uncharacterized protein n=1 Tax=Neurospora intermedia TaxID=5142 RepID=A0ABR3DQC6_NEUIN